MAYSSGTFSRVHDFTTDRDAGIKIQASRMDSELDGFATGLSTAVLKDGTQTTTATVPFAFGISVVDNKAVTLGTNSDYTIQYDETTRDSLMVTSNVEGAVFSMVLAADQGDDAGDEWKLGIADGGVLTIGNDINSAHTYVAQLTLTPNSTVASSTTAVAGNLTASALTVDDVAVNGKVITMTGSSGDTFTTTVGTNGATSLVTVDTAAAAAHLQITADGTVDIDSAGVLTLDSGAAINIEPASGSAILLDGTISIDAGVVTGATSITSTAFVGNITGNVTGNASGTAATVTGAAQSSITSLGTLTTLSVDNITINGNDISSTAGTDLTITPLSGQQIVLDGTIVVDAGVVTGATSITSTAFVGDITGDVTGTADVATVATTVTITDNESTNEDNAIIFTAGGDVDGGNIGLESDGTLTYNPSTGKVTATGFIGALTGAVTGNVAGNLTGTVATATQNSITTATGLVSVGALDSGSITSGFGNIDNGASNVTSGGLVKLDVDSDADDITGDSATGRLTIGAGEDLNLYHGGTHSYIVNDTGNLVINTGASDADIVFSGNDGGSAVTALTLDMSNNGTAIFNKNLNLASDASKIKFGVDGEVTLTHVHDTGLKLGGTTPTLTIGDAGAEDTKIVFDGNAQDFHIGLDDSADDLVIGLGSSLGTTTHMAFDENGNVSMALQPSVNARVATAAIVTSLTTLTSFTESYDIGSNFASGVFTAPSAGKYFASFHSTSDINQTAATQDAVNTGYFSLNDADEAHHNLYYFSQKDATIRHQVWGLSGICHLDAGDTLRFKVSSGFVESGQNTPLIIHKLS